MSPSSYLSLIKRYYWKNLLVLAGVTLCYKNGLRYIDIYSFRKRYSGVCVCVCMCVFQFSSVQFSRSVVSDSLRPHESHATIYQLD